MLTKSRLITLFALLLTLLANSNRCAAQETQDTASTEEPKKHILIIPYEPGMYSCSGDHFICRSSDVTPGELNDLIRRSLLSTMDDNLSLYYNTVVLENDDLIDPNSDISTMYRITDYKKIRKKVKAYYKAFPSFNIFQILGPRRFRWGTDCVNSDAEKPNKVKREYSELFVKNDSLFNQMMQKYEATYCVFITRFEMTTRFKSCIDLQENVYQRDLFVHFTLVDEYGKVVEGGVVGTTFQSSSNQINYIMDKNLGLLSKLVLEILRVTI